MPDFVIGREEFSRRLAEDLSCRYREFRHEYHPDGEPAPRIRASYEDIEGSHVVLVLRGSQLPAYVRVSRNLHNFSRHIGNLSYVFKAKKVDVLMPYFWLGRQDKNPKEHDDPLTKERDRGRDVGYEWLARDAKAQGANRIITFNPHFRREKGRFEISGLEIVSLSGVPALARYAEQLSAEGLISKDSLLTGPDFSASPLQEEFLEFVKMDLRLLEKKRVDGDFVKIADRIDAGGRDVLILDDIFSTLSTVETAVNSIDNMRNIDCFAVHGVFPEEGFAKSKSLRGKVRRFVTTDTVDCDYSRASVIPEIVEFYKKNTSSR